jgi:mRNA interferase MazF
MVGGTSLFAQGEVWWADLGEPVGSAPGLRRPVVVVQCDGFNHTRIATVVCVPLTSNLLWADVPGNAKLSARGTGLSRESVANVSQVTTIDRSQLLERAGVVTRRDLERVLAGIDVVLGR